MQPKMKVRNPPLQWGRNFFVTEIGETLKKVDTTTGKLQWGRNFFVTEISKVSLANVTQHKLQWGRNFFVTEIIFKKTSKSFILAASMGP